MNCYDPLIR
ncbi:MAG: hypothetical protein F4Y39_21825 [Gemmatimonadetes bacterium]|nr:hypothetical protein [Gemmatimonadota bacterium]MYF74951.1 hypothetical protein [Gemmatimonadota bacterium]MYK54674.1 hypothetical protein [Gemmatimonadota bacterium]